MSWFVDPDKANQLNLRRAPKPGDVILSLAAGTKLEKIGAHPQKTIWWEVDAFVAGAKVRGFVHSGYLKQGVTGAPAPQVTGDIPPVHLRRAGKTRRMAGGRAFPLDEAGMPERNAGTAAEVVAIINYLKPDNAAHKRYKASNNQTFCNIYAYDFCQRCKVYMPRVWWTDSALASIRAGTIPPVHYGTTVRELNANMLHDWFIDYGAIFGWRRVFDATDLQDAANVGKVGIIVAKRVNLARSGHIVGVVSEHGGHQAARKGNAVTRPVQSQAGSTNFTAKVTTTRWWSVGPRFQSFGFWVCD